MSRRKPLTRRCMAGRSGSALVTQARAAVLAYSAAEPKAAHHRVLCWCCSASRRKGPKPCLPEGSHLDCKRRCTPLKRCAFVKQGGPWLRMSEERRRPASSRPLCLLAQSLAGDSATAEYCASAHRSLQSTHRLSCANTLCKKSVQIEGLPCVRDLRDFMREGVGSTKTRPVWQLLRSFQKVHPFAAPTRLESDLCSWPAMPTGRAGVWARSQGVVDQSLDGNKLIGLGAVLQAVEPS